MPCSRMKWTSRIGLAVFVLALMPLVSVGQGTVEVKATCGTPSPAWVPYGEYTKITLNAKVTAPAPDEGSTLQGPTWDWTVLKVESSDDGDSFTKGNYYYYEINNSDSANASLSIKFSDGKYWRITCQVTVGYSENPGKTTWKGTATCVAKPNSGTLLTITVASGATQSNVKQIGYPNWAAVKKNDDTVLIQAGIKPNVAEVSNMIQWTNGTAVAGNNKQRTVDKSVSAMTAVRAKIGSGTPSEVDIWIIWATIVNQVTGTTPANAVQFGNNYDKTEKLGVQPYNDGNNARGKVIPVATVTPAGVNTIITGGFAFGRDKQRHDFEDGAKIANRYDNAWIADGVRRVLQAPPKTTVETTPLILDAGDKCYDRDAPNIGAFGQTYSYERYDNFREYLKWNNDMCSDYSGWYFKAVWVKNQAGKNQVNLDVSVVNQGALALGMYTEAKYPPP